MYNIKNSRINKTTNSNIFAAPTGPLWKTWLKFESKTKQVAI